VARWPQELSRTLSCFVFFEGCPALVLLVKHSLPRLVVNLVAQIPHHSRLVPENLDDGVLDELIELGFAAWAHR
jgi:hypothetical protein